MVVGSCARWIFGWIMGQTYQSQVVSIWLKLDFNCFIAVLTPIPLNCRCYVQLLMELKYPILLAPHPNGGKWRSMFGKYVGPKRSSLCHWKNRTSRNASILLLIIIYHYHLSSSIIIYHHLSSSIIIYHHLSSNHPSSMSHHHHESSIIHHQSSPSAPIGSHEWSSGGPRGHCRRLSLRARLHREVWVSSCLKAAQWYSTFKLDTWKENLLRWISWCSEHVLVDQLV